MPKLQIVPPPPPPPRYAEWIAFVFDHPETGPDWYWSLEEDFAGEPEEIAALFIHTMRQCGADLKPFPDNQVKLGLEYLTNNSCSNIVGSLMHKSLGKEMRAEVVRSMASLYTDCFTPRCAPVLCSVPGGGFWEYPLNGFCYMLWDVTPLLSASPDAVIPTLKVGLYSPNPACQESALHGLGHLVQVGHEAAAGVVIEEYIRARAPTGDLRGYADAALAGMIQ